MNLPLLPIIRRLAQAAPADAAALAIVIECAEDAARRHEDAAETTHALAYWESARIARAAALMLELPPASQPKPTGTAEGVAAALALVRQHGVSERDATRTLMLHADGSPMANLLHDVLAAAEQMANAAEAREAA